MLPSKMSKTDILDHQPLYLAKIELHFDIHPNSYWHSFGMSTTDIEFVFYATRVLNNSDNIQLQIIQSNFSFSNLQRKFAFCQHSLCCTGEGNNGTEKEYDVAQDHKS